MKPYYEQSGVTIYHGDCREVLPNCGRFHLMLTDPPYGSALSEGSRDRTPKQRDGNLWGQTWGPMTMTPVVVRDLMVYADHACIWGAHHFCDQLTPGNRWLVWEKGTPDEMSYSACELAWTTIPGGGVYQKTLLWSGFRREGEVRQHWHPTQKPQAIVSWSLDMFVAVESVVDPFMGSGTTLVACKRRGLRVVGIEIKEKYCEIAAKRLQQEALPLEIGA